MLELVALMLPLVEAAALIFARPLGFILVFPVFGWMGLTGMIRNVVAIVIGLPYLVFVYTELTTLAEPIPVELVAALAAKEFLVGMTLGILFGAPFWAAEMAGSYVDVFRGSSSATVVSPDNMSEPLVSGAVFSLALAAIFLSMGGLRVVIGAIYDSYEIWTFFEIVPTFTKPLFPALIEILAKVAKVALGLGAPLIIAMALGEIALAYASRFAQQINVFDATLSIKNLIFMFMLPPYLYILTTHYGPDLVDFTGLLAIVQGLVGR